MLRNLIHKSLLKVPINYHYVCCANMSTIKMADRRFGVDGPAAPLIIMHGLLGSKTNWGGVGRGLEQKLQPKRKIILVDARNHGESPHTSEHSYAHLSKDIVAFAKDNGFQKVAVMGHSMGGRAMMQFVLENPQLVDRAIIVDISPFTMSRDFKFMDRLLTSMIDSTNDLPQGISISDARKLVEEKLVKATGDQGTVSFIMQNLKKLPSQKIGWSVNAKSLLQNLPNISEFSSSLLSKQFQGPTIFIAGNESNFFNKQDWPKIQEIFPNSELHMLNAGHLVHFDQPAKFIEIVSNFLNKT